MKLTADLSEYIENVIRTASIVNIEGVIIDAENGTVRGIDEERTVVLFQDTAVPDFPAEINLFGMNRGSVFFNRLEIVKGREGFDVDAEIVELDDVKYVKALHMASADTKVGYRCANPDSIKAPKQINDTIVYRIQLTAEAVSVLQKGQAAMGTETVSIVSDGAGVAFELEDISEDAMRHVFANETIQLKEGIASTFSHKYPIKTLLSLFKENPDGYFEIGEKGILCITINELNIYVLPQV